MHSQHAVGGRVARVVAGALGVEGGRNRVVGLVLSPLTPTGEIRTVEKADKTGLELDVIGGKDAG